MSSNEGTNEESDATETKDSPSAFSSSEGFESPSKTLNLCSSSSLLTQVQFFSNRSSTSTTDASLCSTLRFLFDDESDSTSDSFPDSRACWDWTSRADW